MTEQRLADARERAKLANETIRRAQEEMAEAIEEVVVDGFADIFSRYEFLGSIVWTQYTPWFNDGEPCVFRSAFTYPSLNSVADAENGTACNHGDEEGEDFGSKSRPERYVGYDENARSRYETNPDFVPRYEACANEVKAFTKALAGDERRDYGSNQPTALDSALLKAFGDHARITVTRGGVEAVEFEHD